jgi:uncharacterized protein (TIGR03435 family)
MLSGTCAVFGVLVASLALEAQNAGAPGAPATFEAASVKEHVEPGDGSFVGRRPGGRFAAQNATLREIIEYAYEIQGHQLIGSLAPIESARWDIAATLGAAGQAGPDLTLPAVRALLADRFGLVTHRERRTLQVYALRVARADATPGPNLTRSALDCPALMAVARRGGGPPPAEARQCGFRGRVGSLQSTGMPLTELALALSGRVGRAVLDQTGLTGPWDVTLTYAPDSAEIPAGTLAPDAPRPAANPDAPPLTAALQEQLGLRLVSTTAPVDVLVVDRVSRPTPD